MINKKTPIVGKIIEVKSHPNAERIFLAIVDTGKDEPIQIIFGGNLMLKPGDLIPVALPGTRLPSGEKIRPRNWRGIKSYGELLSIDELQGTHGGPDEVLLLSNELSVGEPIS